MLTAASDLTQLRAQPVSMLSPAIVIFIFVLGIRLLSGQEKRRETVAAPTL
jgi:ABC-type dipeptide/oligopeptide/nickel transport system permease subunit